MAGIAQHLSLLAYMELIICEGLEFLICKGKIRPSLCNLQNIVYSNSFYMINFVFHICTSIYNCTMFVYASQYIL